MSIRSMEQLRRDQAALMEAYRAGLSDMVLSPMPGMASAGASPASPALLARVAQVVGSDPVHGAHVTVQPQEFAGAPPSAQDASKPALRVYPTPNHVVTDYSIDEFVWVVAASGAMVAVKVG